MDRDNLLGWISIMLLVSGIIIALYWQSSWAFLVWAFLVVVLAIVLQEVSQVD